MTYSSAASSFIKASSSFGPGGEAQPLRTSGKRREEHRRRSRLIRRRRWKRRRGRTQQSSTRMWRRAGGDARDTVPRWPGLGGSAASAGVWPPPLGAAVMQCRRATDHCVRASPDSGRLFRPCAWGGGGDYDTLGNRLIGTLNCNNVPDFTLAISQGRPAAQEMASAGACLASARHSLIMALLAGLATSAPLSAPIFSSLPW